MIKDKFSVNVKETINKPQNDNQKQQNIEETQRSDTQKVFNFCYNYYNKYKRFPKIKEITESTKLKHKQITIILKLLVSKKHIKRINNRYYFPDQKVSRNKKKKVVKRIRKINFLRDKFFYFKILLLIVFSTFLYMGIKYNIIGFNQSKSITDAIIAGVSFIFLGVVFFEFGLFFIKRNIIVSVVLFILFMIVFMYNFFNIFNGQYKKYQSLLYTVKNIEKDNKIKLLDSYNKQIEELEKEIQLQYDFIEKYKDDDKYYWQLWGARNKYIPNLQDEMKIVIDKRDKLLIENVNTEKEYTVFQFISSIFSKKDISNILQLIYLLFPGFIVELVINISLALFFYIQEK